MKISAKTPEPLTAPIDGKMQPWIAQASRQPAPSSSEVRPVWAVVPPAPQKWKWWIHDGGMQEALWRP